MESNHFSHSIQFIVVLLCCLFAFFIRLFSVVITEPIIHEFDPHFNWRCTQYINEHGLYEFLGWFDNISWYPQGRPVGETAYPGLMYTSAIMKWTLQRLHINVDLINICIFTGPCCAVITCLVSFLFGCLIDGSSLGVLSCAAMAIVPGLISRSVAGGYDYECISLLILITCIYTFCYALKNGSIFASMISGLCYSYMCLTWGGYVFISNCIPLFTAALIALGHYSWRLHITYSIWAVVGTLLAASIPFIHEKSITKPEHYLILIVFVGVQVWGLFVFLRKILSPKSYHTIIVSAVVSLPAFFLAFLSLTLSTGLLSGFSGRLLNMFDPSYATKNIPIIASVAEHQPSAWGMYFMDCSMLIILFPLGCFFLLKRFNETDVMLLIWGLSTLYFGSIMVRLVLVFSPGMAFVASIGAHFLLKTTFNSRNSTTKLVTLLTVGGIFLFTMLHSVWFGAYAYSSDQIHFPVRTAYGQEESDDYREAYRWLWSNTGHDQKVMSWWDYGYQITSMGGRACMADGNTNNFTHIGIIGMTMSSPEAVSWRLARLLDTNYMLVVFGGASGYDGDDINKFLWMPKIANQTFHNISGDMYVSPRGVLVGDGMTTNMTLSSMFRFCYNNFNRFVFHPQVQPGFDLARYSVIPHLGMKNTLFEEAFTSKHWIIRIYKVKDDPIWNRVY